MKYCKECLLPDTKPYITFDADGVCNACISHKKKNMFETGIDWKQREAEFTELVLAAKQQKARYFDVMVPVSGGKDSITQVHSLRGYDLRILAVNVDYGIKTEVGHYNLACISDMGASLITYRPELGLHRRLIRLGLEDFGDPDLLSHTLLHAYPLHLALHLQIPLVLLGENSAFEYGGDPGLAQRNTMTREWFSKYAANKGHDASHVSKMYAIPFGKLVLYDFPDEIEASTTQARFMSYYFHWDSEAHLQIAKRYGFRTLGHPSEGTYRDYVGIDEKINRIHQYIKVLKFGYGRATDHACEDIRNGRLTREAAKALVREHDLKPLSKYYVDDFVAFIGVTYEQFHATLEKYRNPSIWKRQTTGTWYIPGHLEDR